MSRNPAAVWSTPERMMDGQRIALPTQVRLDEEGSEPGGWSEFFDATLAWLDGIDARADGRSHRRLRD